VKSYYDSESEGAIFVIGCDLGTQSTKAILLDDQGTVIARAARPYPTAHPAAGWAEQDPRHWMDALTGAVRDAIDASGHDPAGLAAIAVAAQVDGIVAVDADDRPLGPAPIWMDRRATTELATITERIDPETIRAISGANADASHGAPKIVWLRDHLDCRPDGYLLPASFIVAWLSGQRTIDRSNASSLLLLDVATGDWSTRLLDAFGVDAADFGELRPATDVAGMLRSDIAAAWGVPTCPVLVGTGDEHAACVAAGVLRPGVIGDIVGTAEPVAVASDRPIRDPGGLVETHAHVPPSRWLIEHPGFVSAGSVRWLAEAILGCSQAEIGQLARQAPAGADGVRFEPALGGASTPRWNADVLGAFTGLAIGHDRRHLARAVLEGCSLAVRDIVTRLAEIGLAGDAIRVVGGGARDRTWLQIKADVTGCVVETLAEPEATALGAALIAAVGVGWYRDLDAASAATLRLDPVRYEPEAALRALYDDAWAGHRATFDALERLEIGSRP
jgi:xylulokinase